jgi:hypothetical protein
LNTEHTEESRESVGRKLAGLGWEVREDTEAVIGSHGKHYVMVSFEDGKPSSVIISYVGKGGGLLSSKWQGLERLPTPQKVVKALS